MTDGKTRRPGLVPDPTASREEWERYHHLDIPHLTTEEIEAELARLTDWLKKHQSTKRARRSRR